MTAGGAFTNLPQATVAGALAYQKAFPGARTFRWFHGGVPSDIASTTAAGCYAAGLIPFLSVKTSYTAVGSDNAKIVALFASMTGGGNLTDWHEPENDMTAAQYVAVTRNFYEQGKPVNPAVNVCDVAMAYQWDPGRSVPDPHQWDPGNDHCDARGIDIYSEKWRSATATPLPIDKLPGLQRWLGWAGPLGKPLMAVELGCSVAFADAARADWYAHAYDWLAQNGFVLALPWNGLGTPGEQFYYWGGPVAWPLTVAAITKGTLPPPPPPPPVRWSVPESPQVDSQIRALQRLLGVAEDGDIGPATWAALQAYLAAQAHDLAAADDALAAAQARCATLRVDVIARCQTP